MNLGSRYRTRTSCCASEKQDICDRRKIKSVTKSGDKVLVIMDDCTYIEAPFEVVDDSITCKKAVLDELVENNKKLETKVQALMDNVITINKLDGSGSFKALNLLFNPQS